MTNIGERVLVAGAAWGPALFIVSWVAAGLATPGYSPVESFISELAAADAATRPLVTAGLAAYALGVGGAAWPMRRLIGTPSALAAAASAAATVGVALAPLGVSERVDLIHGGFALLAYVATVAIGLLAGIFLLRKGMRIGWLSVAIGLLSAAFLVASGGDAAPGLFQRLGLTTTDALLITVGVAGTTARVRDGHHESRSPRDQGHRT